MLQFARNLLHHREETPITFSRPLVVLQSDDWGRVGIRDQEGYDQLCSRGIRLGASAYDFYSLETAGDLQALASLLSSHRDAAGNNPRLVMNFCLANLDFPAMRQKQFREIKLLPLSHGLPGSWSRPGLLDEYRAGIEQSVFYPALHGLTHFCAPAVEIALAENGQRAQMLRRFWEAETPYIFWRMPWIGYEYCNPDPHLRFLDPAQQRALVREACRLFEDLFGRKPESACAPGYRSNAGTHRAWVEAGIRTAQHGTGAGLRRPFLDELGILHLFRAMDFEPGQRRVEPKNCWHSADACFTRGIPFIISVHSINFHSSLRDFRTPTLAALDELLTALESRYPELLYVTDAGLYPLATAGRMDHAAQLAMPVSSGSSEPNAARGGA